MVPPTAGSSVLVYSASGLGHDLLIAHLEEKREPWRLSVHNSLTFSSQCDIAMDTMVQGRGQLLIMPTPFPNYDSGYTNSGTILYMWQKIKVLKLSQQIPVYQIFEAAIIVDV